ncbi:MAG TPA: response regulator transcription factor [Rariglobus sp.]
MSAPSRCRTLVVEDQTLFRSFLTRLLRADPRFELVGETGDGLAARDLVRELRPRLLVLDLHIPGIDGLELAARVAAESPDTRVLALTSRRDAYALSRVMALDLAGYVEKEQPVEVLEEALQTISAGGNYFTPTVRAMRRRLAAEPDSFNKILGDREVDVLRRVAAGRPSKRIAEELGLSIRTVESHRYRLMRKLELSSVAELVEYAIRHGLHTVSSPS